MTDSVRREPVLNVPFVVTATLVLLGAIHAVRQLLPAQMDDVLVSNFAFVPLRMTAVVDPAAVVARVAAWRDAADVHTAARTPFAAYLLTGVRTPAPLTLLTYALLHGSWTHFGFNAVWLLAFGTPVARRFGPARFAALFAVAAVAGALTHWVLFPFDLSPLVGASAAISGCMGAALRFAFTFPALGDDPGRPAVDGLWGALRNTRALSFLVVWFISNALFGVGSAAFGLSDAPVAWQAHIGGLLVGLLLFRLFDPPQPVEPTGPV